MATTAEGVETDEQLGQLREEGCTEVQGYLFSKPLPATDVLPLLDKVHKQMRAAIETTEHPTSPGGNVRHLRLARAE